MSGEATGRSGAEGLDLGSYLEEGVLLLVVVDLDRKMAFLIGRIQNGEGGEAGGPQWMAEALKWAYRRLMLGLGTHLTLREPHGWLLGVQDLAHITPSHVSSLAT